ncbi:hypothetical protein B0A80_02280 [Flavobacterium tructae]|nr:hypothetical protein B0A80_02280 [Flavobacterium tructae]
MNFSESIPMCVFVLTKVFLIVEELSSESYFNAFFTLKKQRYIPESRKSTFSTTKNGFQD